MKISDADIKQTTDIIQYAIYLNSFLIMIDFSVQKNKTDVLTKINEAVKAFDNSLTTDEKNKFAGLINGLMEQKTNEFLDSLQGQFTEGEIDEVVAAFKAGVTSTPLQDIQNRLKALTSPT